ncbi:MAG: hypothetical protein K0B15_08715 [Lentimicrobium sp.]|nr:hypothetical protein [Lentimicrobium sp.]
MLRIYWRCLLRNSQATVFVGKPPLWGPAGYNNVQYYYLPDLESYYDVNNSRFIYYEGGTWVHRKYLPRQYRSYDLYSGYKVVMHDYRGNSPYAHFKEHKSKYARGYKGQEQKTIGNRPDQRKQGLKNAKQNHPGQKVSKMNQGKIKGHNGKGGGGKGRKK